MTKTKGSHTCKKGDRIIHKGAEMSVLEIYEQGRSGWVQNGKLSGRKKARVVACRVLPDRVNTAGQVLTRSPFLIEDEWEHKET